MSRSARDGVRGSMRLLRLYLGVVRPHWVGAVMIAAATLLTGIVVTALQDEVYRAEASAVVSVRSLDVLSPADDAEVVKSRASSYMIIARSMPVAESVARDLRSDTAAVSLLRRVEVRQPAGTAMLKVIAEDDSPLGAQNLANAWVEALVVEVQELEGRGDKRQSHVSLIPVDGAGLPASPASPNPVRNLAAALGLGLLLGFAYALARRLTLSGRSATGLIPA